MSNVLRKLDDTSAVQLSRPLPWRAQRNLARQVDELIAAGEIALVRELISSDLTRARTIGAMRLCTQATRDLLMANKILRSVANDAYEHAIVTRNMAFAEATVQHIIATTYA